MVFLFSFGGKQALPLEIIGTAYACMKRALVVVVVMPRHIRGILPMISIQIQPRALPAGLDPGLDPSSRPLTKPLTQTHS